MANEGQSSTIMFGYNVSKLLECSLGSVQEFL